MTRKAQRLGVGLAVLNNFLVRMTRSGMSVGNWLIVRMLRSANGLGNTVNNDLSGWIRVLPAGPIFGLSAFSVCSQRRLYRQRLRPKAIREKSFLPHLNARKAGDCTDGGNGGHVDA